MKLSKSQSTTPSKRAGGRQRGSSLVEAALVFPLLILVIIGIMEIGLAFKDYLTVSYVSREAARVGALAGNDANADCAILRGIGTVATSRDLNRITSVQIFKAGTNGAQGATNVATFHGGDPSKCHVPAQVGDTWTINPVGWVATTRKTTVGSTALDLIGVRIIMTHDWVTNFPPFTGTINIDESTITRLEPKVFQ
ncbi:MAG TPA: TadE/TadG family type IV pilus assembly protein [Acidimicrobiia bacterium]